MGYNFMILISEKADVNTESLAEKIKKFKVLDLKVAESYVQALFNLYDHHVTFNFHLESKDTVLAESQEIANRWASTRKDKEVIASCNRRFSMFSQGDTIDDFDFCMDLLNSIQTINGIYIFDPVNGSFWDNM